MAFIPPTYDWKLWYEDGSMFSSTDGQPWESPELGLVLVTQPDMDYDILRDVNHYLYREDIQRWVNFDNVGLFDQLTARINEFSCYRLGRWIPVRSEWLKIRDKAILEVRGK